MIKAIIEKHDIITKFVSYCLRLLDKFGTDKYHNKEIIYHIVATLDKIADVYKNVARDILQFKPKISKKTLKYLEEVVSSIDLYMKLFYKFNNKCMIELNKRRDNFKKELKTNLMKMTKEEIIILKDMEHVLEILADLIVARSGLEI